MIHIFVINHTAGASDLAKDLRRHLSTIVGLRYFVFNTQKAGYERYFVKKMNKYFGDEKLRFYCCGGSGTLRNMLDGIEDFDKVEVAFFPCGATNDFLKCFGSDEPFKNIDNLIFGKTVKVDYIKTNYGVALNTLSLGFDSAVVRSMTTYKVYDIIGKQLPYVMSIVTGLLFTKQSKLELTIDGVTQSSKYVEVVIGNGCVLGGNLYYTEKNDITDGELSYLTVANQNVFQSVIKLVMIMNKKLFKIKGNNIKTGSASKVIIRSLGGKKLFINFDGELVDCGNECEIEVVKRGLKFIVPRSVEVKEFNLDQGR